MEKVYRVYGSQHIFGSQTIHVFISIFNFYGHSQFYAHSFPTLKNRVWNLIALSKLPLETFQLH